MLNVGKKMWPISALLVELVGVAGFEPAIPSSRTQWHREQQVNSLREFFGTQRADFGTLCPFRSHLRNSAAKRESEERTNYQRLLARPKRFELLTPRFVVCKIQGTWEDWWRQNPCKWPS